MNFKWYDILTVISAVYLAINSHAIALLVAAVAIGVILYTRFKVYSAAALAKHLTKVFNTHPTHTEPHSEYVKSALQLFPTLPYQEGKTLRDALRRHYVTIPSDTGKRWEMVHVSKLKESDA